MSKLQLGNDVPWKQRYRARTILWSQISKSDPTKGLVCSNVSGVYQLHSWDVRTGALAQLTHAPEGKVSGGIFPDGRFVWYLQDKGGNELGHYVRVPIAGGEPEDLTPEMRPYASWDLSIAQAGNLLGFTSADDSGFHSYLIDISPDGALGEPRLICESETFVLGPVLSHDGDLAVISSSARSGSLQYSLVALAAATGALVAELWDGPGSSIEHVRVQPAAGECWVTATSDRTGDRKPLLWKPWTNERVDLPVGGLQGDLQTVDWSPGGTRLLICHSVDAVQRFHVYDLSDARLIPLNHPAGAFSWHGDSGTYFVTKDEIFAGWENSTHPPQVVALDAATGVQTRVVLEAGAVSPGRPWQSVTFVSCDGQRIQGWLGLPEGHGPFPTLLATHGGPEAVENDQFDPASQAWLDHGFAYLTINYRGSTTFGREFRQQIWGHPGEWEVEDMVAARQWLVERGISRPGQILLTGWSYGGYLTLQALGKRPELWAGGMAGIAIADWSVSYADCADTLRGYFRALFGGTPEEKPAQYAASSPMTYAQQVAAPVLIIQGRNDTRTPARPVEMYERKMKALGKQIEVHWFEAGHGSFAQVEPSIEHQERMLRFAYRVLGLEGR